jgi:hypothetical protein
MVTMIYGKVQRWPLVKVVLDFPVSKGKKSTDLYKLSNYQLHSSTDLEG